MNHESPIINGDGTYSQDFTYIDKAIQMNLLALTTENKAALNQVYNTAVGNRTTLAQQATLLKQYLFQFDPAIAAIEIKHGPNRAGDIPHSLASVEKAKSLLGYNPQFKIAAGLAEALKWYWDNI